MTSYTAPIADMRFVMVELAGLGAVGELPGLEDATPDLVDAVLEEAAKFAANVLAPLNRAGDVEGTRLVDGQVRTTPGWKAAYQAFVEAGWNGLVFGPEWGGQGLPWLVNAAVQEMWHASNMSFGLCPLLTQGAIEAILFHGSEEQKQLYLHKWVSLSFPQFGEIGGNARFDDGVVGGRSDGYRLLDEAVKQEAAGL